jgi:glycogen operon protein
MSIVARSGSALPLGARCDARGINFAVYAPDVASLALLLYESAGAGEPFARIALDPAHDRSGGYWHVYVEGVRAGVYYTWQADALELLDPCARELSTARWNRAQATKGATGLMRARAVADDDYDWEGDAPPVIPHEQAIIYELHVGGFTRHPSSGVQRPGSYAGVIEKIPYLKSLGVTHVELMPVMAFDEQDVPDGTAALGLRNYWGYSPAAFLAPHAGYASSPESARRELRDLVKALHRAGLGIILDIVLNHSCEGGEGGPTLHMKALARRAFYHVDDAGRDVNISGVGNTINCNHPATSRMLLDCVEWWAREMHVDGFRFDMASVLTRGQDGAARADAWLPGALADSPALARAWLIAEPWDAAGLYQVGSFPGARYAEWNGRYRDVVRRFLRGEPGLVGELAQRIAGSSDLYAASGRTPAHSINFVTCHDGFTLWDLVSYERKHNEGNGEGNRYGNDANWSSNCGIEGETSSPPVLRLRARQVRNFMTILFLSQGVPMILAGDELLRTQTGNNNAWCHDDEIGWIDWSLAETNAGMLRFMRALIALRRRHPSLMRRSFLAGARKGRAGVDIAWHGVALGEPRWRDSGARVLGFTLAAAAADEADLHAVLNMSPRAFHAPLPVRPGGRWHRAIDTWRALPQDIVEPGEQVAVDASSVLVHGFSVVVLEGRA